MKPLKPPLPFAVWLSHHMWVVWTYAGVPLIATFVVMMFIGFADVWYIIGAVLLGNYLIMMYFITRMLRGVKAEADYLATRRDSK